MTEYEFHSDVDKLRFETIMVFSKINENFEEFFIEGEMDFRKGLTIKDNPYINRRTVEECRQYSNWNIGNESQRTYEQALKVYQNKDYKDYTYFRNEQCDMGVLK